MSEGWIVVRNWERFQHYRDRNPAWIKDYTEQLSDQAYLELSFHQRGVLHGLRMEYARSTRQIRDSTLTVSRRLGQRVSRATLDALNHAGFSEFSASKPLAPGYHGARSEKYLRTSKKRASARASTSGSRKHAEEEKFSPESTPDNNRRRGRKVSPYAAAEAMTRNGGWQYATEAFHEELARFDLNDNQRTRLEAIRDELIEEDW